MRFPRQVPKKTPNPVLPSILTLFPAQYNGGEEDTPSSSAAAGNEAAGDLDDAGLEIVPIERSNTSCGKTVSPGTEEKEVLAAELSAKKKIQSKPLPPLPRGAWTSFAKSRWYRLPVKRRVFTIISVQFILLSIIGLSLLSIKHPLTKRNANDPLTDPSTCPGLPPIPEGSFLLNLDYPRQQSSACLFASNESASWLCASRASLTLTISRQSLSMHSTPNTSLSSYGEQPFSLRSAALTLVAASTYSFRGVYDRTVLVAGPQLSFKEPSHRPRPRTRSAAGNAWLCFFNDTVVQGLVYASQPTTHNTTTAAATNATTPSFPFALHLTQEWIANGTRAYCEEQKVNDDGRMRSAADAPKYFLNTTAASSASRRRGAKRNAGVEGMEEAPVEEGTGCECEWVVR